MRAAGARLKEKSAAKTKLCRGAERASVAPAMNYPHYLRIERDGPGRPRHYVVHVADPKFSLELTPDRTAPDQMGRGVIKRICVPNSWAGDYARYSRPLGVAQDFFAQSSTVPEPEAELRRFQP